MAKYRKSNKNTKKNKKNYSRKYKNLRKGGCGCNSNREKKYPIMIGGYGPSNLPESKYYYEYAGNPNAVQFPQSSRNMNGGKKIKNISRKNPKIMRGGNMLTNWLINDPFNNNYVQFTGNTPGSFLGNNIINGIPNSSNSVTDGPLLYPDRSNIA
jgi:hypothetical protein